ncbi:MAG: hydroxylase [Alteromonadaceae bacterium]|nr:hydroxylase [Alteromonadaceae bacterium]
MQIHYLEIVTNSVDDVCGTYEATQDITFSAPEPMLGNARTAKLVSGTIIGVRAPMRDTEAPVVRPYALVEDIDYAVTEAEKAGGQIALPPMDIPGYGRCAIYIVGGNDMGLWQL